eukprot:710578_1
MTSRGKENTKSPKRRPHETQNDMKNGIISITYGVAQGMAQGVWNTFRSTASSSTKALSIPSTAITIAKTRHFTNPKSFTTAHPLQTQFEFFPNVFGFKPYLSDIDHGTSFTSSSNSRDAQENEYTNRKWTPCSSQSVQESELNMYNTVTLLLFTFISISMLISVRLEPRFDRLTIVYLTFAHSIQCATSTSPSYAPS